MGVNRRVINLGSDPTYENSRVALNDFWERTIVPMRRRHASTLSSQLLPLFGLDPAQYRLRFDFSEVEALSENLDALHARWRETFAAGGIDLFTFQEKIGLKPDESLRGRFVKASQPLDDGDEMKSHPDQPRDRLGRWTNGGGFLAPDDGVSSSGAWPKPPEKAAQFETKEAATDWLKNNLGKTFDQVDNRERAAIYGFKTFTFDSINEILRTDKSDVLLRTKMSSSGQVETEAATLEEIKKDEIPAIDRAISKFTLPHDIVVERSTDASYWHGPLATGKVLQELGYQSTTVWPEYNQRWHSRQVARGNYKNNGVVLEIHLKKGHHALPMQPFEEVRVGNNDPQFEIVLPRNGLMKVRDVIQIMGKPKRIVIDWEEENHAA